MNYGTSMLQALHDVRLRLSSKFDSVSSNLSCLLRRTEAPVSGDKGRTAVLPVTRRECDELGSSIVQLDQDIRNNVAQLTARFASPGGATDDVGGVISHSHSGRPKTTHFAPGTGPDHRLLVSSLCDDLDFDMLLWGLSVLYARVRCQEQEAAGSGSDDSGDDTEPDKLQSSTRTYWVRPEHLISLECEVLKHMPVLTDGKPDPAQRKGNGGSVASLTALRKMSGGVSSLSTSIFFDNANLDAYQARLKREDEAAMIQLRWYGRQSPDAEVPLLVDHSVHKEKWTLQQSYKERAKLSQGLVPRFLAGDATVLQEAYQPEEDGYKCLQAVQQTVTVMRQEPQLRTEYRRTAFAPYDKQDTTRIAIDYDMLLIRERGAPRAPGAASWCRDPDAPLGCNDVIAFPYAVVEVRLGGRKGSSAWVKDLVASGMLVEVVAFSRFQHGMALLYPKQLHNTPCWFVPNDQGGMEPATIEEMGYQGDQYKESAASWLFPDVKGQDRDVDYDQGPTLAPRSVKPGVHGAKASYNNPLYSGVSQPSPTVTSAAAVTPEHVGIDMRMLMTTDAATAGKYAGSAVGAGGGDAAARKVDYASTGVAMGDEQLIASGAAPNGSPRSTDAASGGEGGRRPGRMARIKIRLFGRRGGKGGDDATADGGKDDKLPLPRAKSIVRTRIEPKTFFSAERTFMAWLNIAVLLMLTGLSLLAGGVSLKGGGTVTVAGGNTTECDSSCRLTKIAGAVICPIAVLFMIYALYMYKKRTYQILRRENVRYDDQRGPVALTVLLIFATVISFALTLNTFRA